jgi:hypothetical protein
VAQVPHFTEVAAERGITDVANITDMLGNGAAAADFDNDGDIDFYLTTDDGIPDRLYENDGTGHFSDVAAQKGILETKNNRAALWFDFNGDRRPDLVVAGENCVASICANPVRLALYQQLENGHFSEVTAQAGLLVGPDFDNVPFFGVGGLAAGDLNQDGFLDLIFTVWGGGIKLFQNNGDGNFSDMTASAGLIMEKKTAWQPMLHDFNGDGWQDIYCNVDFAPNKLWINKSGTFEDQAAQYGLGSAFNEMGMTMGDADNDGDLDIYMTNITRDFQGQPQYNVLLKQEQENGQVIFKEKGRSQGVSQSGWDWGTTFIDINNDGRQDLTATNGWWNELDYPKDRSNLWLNTKVGFVDISGQCGFDDMLDATTLLGFDMDRDGDSDILQTLKDNANTQMPVSIYENKLEESSFPGHYLTIQPRIVGPNYFAIGSVVTVVADDLFSARLISAGCSFYGQEPAEAFFGLGEREAILEAIVRWPDGKVSIYQNIAVNQTIQLDYDFIQPPSDLAAAWQDRSIELTWQDNSEEETAFVLYKSEHPDFSERKTIMLAENATQYNDSEVEFSKNYYYKIRAHRPEILSGDSNTALVSAKGSIGTQTPSSLILPVQPNPIHNDVLIAQSNTAYKGIIHFSLYDSVGRLAWNVERLKSLSSEKFDFPLSLPHGLYVLQAKIGGKVERQKVAIF